MEPGGEGLAKHRLWSLMPASNSTELSDLGQVT